METNICRNVLGSLIIIIKGTEMYETPNTMWKHDPMISYYTLLYIKNTSYSYNLSLKLCTLPNILEPSITLILNTKSIIGVIEMKTYMETVDAIIVYGNFKPVLETRF